MATPTDYRSDLSHIRSMMERSSRFISLSGQAGIWAGVFALLGAAAAYLYLDLGTYPQYYEGALRSSTRYDASFITFFLVDALVVLFASLAAGVYFTTRKARKHKLPIWDKTASLLTLNLLLPLAAGGLFCLALFYHQAIGLIAPATLLFYGLALLNASKYTFTDIRYLGLCEIGLGLIASFFIGYGLLFWAIGFGVLHIVYGAVMYHKYEQPS